MAIADLVHQITTGIGTGTLTLVAINGKQTFNQAFGNGATTNVFPYFISNRNAPEWEVGTGHMSDATTLVRDTVLFSSNSNAAVSFTAGTKDVSCDLPASQQAQGPIGAPGGRLTLATGTPVMTTTQSAKTSILYTPYMHDKILINDGVSWSWKTFTELSNDTTASSTGKAGPAAVTTNSNYDLFGWSDAGTPRITRGPLWTSDTGRGTGAGTTELQRVNGVLTNKVAITNGPGANLGTYLGTVRSNGSSQIDFIFGASAAGGTAAVHNVWNMYNRVDVNGIVIDTTDSWPYTIATWRSADNSAAMRCSFVCGLAEDAFSALYGVAALTDAGAGVAAGIGYDSTTGPSGIHPEAGGVAGLVASVFGSYATYALGAHYFQALEISTAAGTTTWLGDAGGTLTQSGLQYRLRM